MKMVAKFLSGVVLSVGGAGILLLAPTAVGAQGLRSDLPISQRVSQIPQQAPQSNTMLARLSLRITELENEIRRLTGENEELTHRLGQVEETLKKSVSDAALRLSELERGAGAAATTPPVTANVISRASSKAPTSAGSVKGANKGAKVLGTLRGGPAAAARAVEPEAVAKAETPEQQYDRAHALIVKQRKYGEAERVLRNFIDGNPKHSLTSNAHYWLGRTFFVRADYENAAFAFAEGFQKFPDAEKAPANLLNLGMSLARLGKNREACTTYTRLLRTYKKADASIKRRITRERRRAKCRSR